MKRAIITRIIVWIATIAVVTAGGFAAVKVIENINNQQQQEESISYELNTESFEGIVAYGDTIDLSLIKITKTENGVTCFDIALPWNMDATVELDVARASYITVNGKPVEQTSFAVRREGDKLFIKANGGYMHVVVG